MLHRTSAPSVRSNGKEINTNGIIRVSTKMRRSVCSNNSKIDSDECVSLQEPDVARLKTQLRTMEGERQAYILQSQELIRKQRQEIKWLEAEQEELQRSLHVCESHGQRDAVVTQDLLILLDRKDELDKQLERERLTLGQLDKEILSMGCQVVRYRNSNTRCHKWSQVPLTQKAARILENNLDRAVTRFNKHLTRNRQLREDLESLRVNRIQFQQMRHQLEKELQQIHKDIRDAISLSTAVYDARVEVQMKIIMMKKKAANDLMQYSIQMKELEKVITHERHLQDFMNIKNQERSGQVEGLDKSQRQDVRERREVVTQESLEEMFTRIHSLTKEEDLDLLVNRFIRNEDENFALFKKINEQTIAAETLRDQIYQIQRDLEQHSEEEKSKETEHHTLLGYLQAQQRAANSRAEGYEAHADTIVNILDQVKTDLGRILHRLDCVQWVSEDTPYSSSEVRDRKLLALLDLVQQKSNQLLSIHAFVKSKNPGKYYHSKDVARVLLSQRPKRPIQCTLISEPSVGDDSDSPFTEEERPWTQKELRQRMIKEILQKEGIIGPSRGRAVRPSRLSMVSSSQKRHPEV